MKILLVEDDESTAVILKKVLVDEHHAVDVAKDGETGWQLVQSFKYDLVVLDIVLPKLSGLQFCQRLRDEAFNMPVLLITALDSSQKKIAGLDAGADDYLTKPFEMEEFRARVRVLLRRVQVPIQSIFRWGELKLDLNSREVHFENICLNLTPKEYCILELLLRNPSQVFSRGAILDSLWSSSEAPGEDTVTAHIKGLRRKLTEVGAPNDLIKTVYGVGYRLKPIEPSDIQAEQESSAKPAILDTLPKSTNDKQKTRSALKHLWLSMKSLHFERLDVLKQATEALQNNQLSDELHESATQAAHSLTGALGIFGLISGSNLARSIENILRSNRSIYEQKQKFCDLIDDLESKLTQALQQIEQPQAESSYPLLILVDDDLLMLQRLAEVLRHQGLRVQSTLREDNLYKLRSLLTEVRQSFGNGGNLSDLDIDNPPPDIMLLNFSLANSDDATLQRLSTWINKAPSLLLLVSSSDGSLSNRIKATRLGSHSFFHNQHVCELLPEILELRSHLQCPANKVLAVDDDPDILRVLHGLLEPQGLQLTTLSQPCDFWSTLQTSSPDLVLLDIEMPGLNGIELCRVIRQSANWNWLPIIFLTSHGNANVKASALRVGANDLVEKSLADTELIPRLCEHLKRSQLNQAMSATTNNLPGV